MPHIKTVILSGGSGFLGSNLVDLLVEKSYEVIVLDIKYNKNFDKFNNVREFKFINIDITDENAISNLYKKFVNEKKKVDVLINNAAINPSNVDTAENFSRLEDFKMDQWNRELNVGLTAAYLLSKYFGQIIKESDDGVILNVSSDLGIIAPDQRIYSSDDNGEQPVKPVTYSVIKHGLIGLTKYLSTYWMPNLRSLAICPGGIENNQSDLFISKVSELIPLGRMAKVNEICDVIEFLISDKSKYMNGSVVTVDGGRSAW